MKTRINKLFALLMALLMVLDMFPVSALADDSSSQQIQQLKSYNAGGSSYTVNIQVDPTITDLGNTYLVVEQSAPYSNWGPRRALFVQKIYVTTSSVDVSTLYYPNANGESTTINQSFDEYPLSIYLATGPSHAPQNALDHNLVANNQYQKLDS